MEAEQGTEEAIEDRKAKMNTYYGTVLEEHRYRVDADDEQEAKRLLESGKGESVEWSPAFDWIVLRLGGWKIVEENKGKQNHV